jgi:asparagine synthase (glutamine-hydrolysing)
MCGIAGLWCDRPVADGLLRSAAQRMQQSIAHRGPDGEGVWEDAEAGLALAHRRLAVIDLSDAGAQPMGSASGRYILTYNGEIYNFEALRDELVESGWRHPWRGSSDTEVMLAAIEHWGFEATLPRLDGMFALALWDRRERRLMLARDRFGEKPLYYGLVGKRLLFGSELRALRAAAPDGLGDWDTGAVEALVRGLCIPAPLSIYRSVMKLAPAHYVRIAHEDLTHARLPEPEPFWDAAAVALGAAADPFKGTAEDAAQQLGQLLHESVRTRLVADVSVGAMLSGGIDSSTICAFAQAASGKPLRTFTIGFEDAGYDEAPYAAAVAERLGTDHTTIRVGTREIVAAVPEMPHIYDEPFADSSQVNTTILSQALRREVTVALSGDAGDELFGGYVRYRAAPGMWARLRPVPHPLRRAAARALRSIGQGRVASVVSTLTAARGEQAGRIEKALGLIDSVSPGDLYQRLLSVWPTSSGRRACSTVLPGSESLSFARRMMLADTLGYLPSDILAKVDRAAMSVALETRIPFLSPAIFSFAWSLPDAFLLDRRRGKLLLRRTVEPLLPSAMLDRPKQGFAIPLAAWLRGPLREWADEMVTNEQVSVLGVLDAKLVRQAWESHCAGRSDETARLWPVLMFEAWRRTQRSGPAALAA